MIAFSSQQMADVSELYAERLKSDMYTLLRQEYPKEDDAHIHRVISEYHSRSANYGLNTFRSIYAMVCLALENGMGFETRSENLFIKDILDRKDCHSDEKIIMIHRDSFVRGLEVNEQKLK